MFFKKYIGDRAFYKRVLAIMIPVLIQNVITNFVSLLDNIMVGRVGTEPMSGVAIVNQLFFVFFLSIFGSLAGPGVYMSQFFGKGDKEGVRRIFKLKLIVAVLISAIAYFIIGVFGDALINLFLHDSDSNLDLEYTYRCAREYLDVMLVQIPLFAINQAYASTLRETGDAELPMRAGIAAVLVNLVFNWILIYGKLGAPALGATGAAIATVFSRVVEMGIILFGVYGKKEKYFFVGGAIHSRIPASMLWIVVKMGTPMLLNELLWSLSMSTMNQSYSLRGLEAVSATNITSTVSNLFYCACFAFGTTVSIIIGQLLGAGETDRAVDEVRKLIAFDFVICLAIGIIMFLAAPFIPFIYNTTDNVRFIAGRMLMVSAFALPVDAICNPCYFTLRSGGRTMITFLFDCGFCWLVMTLTAFILSRYTDMSVIMIYLVVQSTTVLKALIGIALVKSKCWVRNLVE